MLKLPYTLNQNNHLFYIYHQWKVILGELVIKMDIIFNSLTKKEECVLLSETMLNLIDESGKLTYHKN